MNLRFTFYFLFFASTMTIFLIRKLLVLQDSSFKQIRLDLNNILLNPEL